MELATGICWAAQGNTIKSETRRREFNGFMAVFDNTNAV
jgi:hypothetical protein